MNLTFDEACDLASLARREIKRLEGVIGDVEYTLSFSPSAEKLIAIYRGDIERLKAVIVKLGCDDIAS
jgi:hypothetical protein